MHAPQNTVYAECSGNLIHISEASRGASCGCHCVVCGEPLVARKGQIREHHFAHFGGGGCIGAGETILHRLSKEFIQEMSSIVIPPYVFKKFRKLKRGSRVEHAELVVHGGEVTIDRVDLETAEDGFVPDVTLYSGPKKLIIEIAVTNAVSRDKLRFIRKSNLPAIEIFLEEEDALLSKDELRIKLRNDLDSKKWLFHPRQREAERNYLKKLREEIRKFPVRTRPNLVRMAGPSVKKEFSYSYATYKTSTWEQAIYDRNEYEFRRKHKREPTDEERQKFWPL